MIELITLSFASYAIAFVVASSGLLEPVRLWFMRKTPKLKIGNHKHFAECRMCVTFWSSVLICNSDWKMILPVYGLAYFLATQER